MSSRSSQHLPIRLSDVPAILFVLCMPLSVFWPVGEPVADGLLPIYGAPGIYLTDAVAVVFVLFAVIDGKFSRKDLPGNVLKDCWPLLALPIIALATSFWALSSQLAVFTAFRWLLALGVYLTWRSLKPDYGFLTKVFLAGLALNVIIGLFQFILKSPLGIPGELALTIDRPRSAVLWLQETSWLRAYGMTFHPNVFGGFLAAGIIIGLPLLNKLWVRILWWGLITGLLITFSRSAWLASVIILPLTAAWLFWKLPDTRRAYRLTFLPVIIFLSLCVIFLSEPILSRLHPSRSLPEYTSLSGRGELINLAFEMIKQNILVGIGAGNFPLASLSAGIHDAAHSVHNVALMLAAELGLLGGFLWYWLWLAPVLRVGKVLQNADPWPVVMVGSWFCLGVISLWDSYPWSLESGRLLSVSLLAWTGQAIRTSHLMTQTQP